MSSNRDGFAHNRDDRFPQKSRAINAKKGSATQSYAAPHLVQVDEYYHWTDDHPIKKSMLEDNVFTGIFHNYTRNPTRLIRCLIFATFLTTGIFHAHWAELWGPTCHREYYNQCGPFTIEPWVHQGKQGHMVNTGIASHLNQAGKQSISLDKDATTNNPLNEINEARIHAAVALDDFIYNITLDDGYNCSQPMCDIWAPFDIPTTIAQRFFTIQMSFRGQEDAVLVPGVCRCKRSTKQERFQKILDVSLWVIIQTAVALFFKWTLEADDKDCRLPCSCGWLVVMCVMGIVQLYYIFLYREWDSLWQSLLVSAIEIITIQPLKSYIRYMCGGDRIKKRDNDYLEVTGGRQEEPERRKGFAACFCGRSAPARNVVSPSKSSGPREGGH